MKLARVIALPSSLALAFALFPACSDPPAPPAQAALLIQFNNGTGTCLVPGNPFTIPNDPAGQPGVVSQALMCDLTNAGCKPDAYVAVQGDPSSTVSCSVSASGDVTLQLETPKLHFNAVGNIGVSGGTIQAFVYEQSSSQQVQDKNCTATITTNEGSVKQGAVWARFTCPEFKDPNSPSSATCTAAGAFIFENCGG